MIPAAKELMPDLNKETILKIAQSFDPLTRLEHFSKRFPSAMAILRIGGVHPAEQIEMVNPYTNQPDAEVFTNIGEHCLAVACFAEVIATKLYEKDFLKEVDAAQTPEKGLIHDANKRIEVLRRKALKTGVIEDAYSPKAYETIRPILLAQGIDQETVDYMARAGSETSHLSIKDFLTLTDGIPSLTPGRMVDKIIHLADDMTATSIPQAGEKPQTVYLTPWERMVASEFPDRYPFLWKEGLGFDSAGKVVSIQDIKTAEKNLLWVRSYAYWQPFISNEICQEIQNIIDPKSPQKPEYFIKELVNNVLAPAA